MILFDFYRRERAARSRDKQWYRRWCWRNGKCFGLCGFWGWLVPNICLYGTTPRLRSFQRDAPWIWCEFILDQGMLDIIWCECYLPKHSCCMLNPSVSDIMKTGNSVSETPPIEEPRHPTWEIISSLLTWEIRSFHGKWELVRYFMNISVSEKISLVNSGHVSGLAHGCAISTTYSLKCWG